MKHWIFLFVTLLSLASFAEDNSVTFDMATVGAYSSQVGKDYIWTNGDVTMTYTNNNSSTKVCDGSQTVVYLSEKLTFTASEGVKLNTLTATYAKSTKGDLKNNWGWTTNATNIVAVSSENQVVFSKSPIEVVGSCLEATYFTSITITYTATQYVRELTSSNMGTICLPYAVSHADYAGAVFYRTLYKTYGENTTVDGIVFEEVLDLEAGMPYLFQPEQGASQITCLYSGKPVAEPKNSNGLYGTFSGINGAATTDVLLDNFMVSQNQILQCPAGCSLQPNRAYIRMDEVPTENRSASIPGRKQLTVSGNIHATPTGWTDLYELPISDVHDILGRTVSHPRQAGFYIMNGQKIMLTR